MSLLEKAEKLNMAKHKISLPKISNPRELVEVEYVDMGNTQSPDGKFYTTIFKINNKEFRNDFYYEWREGQKYNYYQARFESDRQFLQQHDLDINMAS